MLIKNKEEWKRKIRIMLRFHFDLPNTELLELSRVMAINKISDFILTFFNYFYIFFLVCYTQLIILINYYTSTINVSICQYYHHCTFDCILVLLRYARLLHTTNVSLCDSRFISQIFFIYLSYYLWRKKRRKLIALLV